MRYQDGPSVEVEILVDAPVDRVWELVRDINLPGRFSDEFCGAEWLDGASGPAVGARFRGRNHHPAIGQWETISTIVECAPGRCMAWVVEDVDNPASQWRFELDGRDGFVRLRQRATLGPGPSGTSVEIEVDPANEAAIIERRLAEHRVNMLRNLEGIKALAEDNTRDGSLGRQP